MSKKRTKTERTERQLDALDLLARMGKLPSHLEGKRIDLRSKLTRLYEGAAKRQARGLVTRLLHETPPFERHAIDRTEPEKPSKPVKMILCMHKSTRRTYNAILRGQLDEGRFSYKHGPYLRTWHVPVDWTPSRSAGRKKKAIEITQRKITYAPPES